MKVLQLVDSLEYVRTNCYQHQLHEALALCCELTVVPLGDIRSHDPWSHDVILSTLKLRTIVRNVDTVAGWLAGRSITVYEQDPWESFIDTGGFRGAYQLLQERLIVRRFLNTSQGWVDRINATLGLDRSHFVRMWVLARHCDEGLPWDRRPIDVGFMGTLHPYRQRMIDDLERLGVHTHVEPPGSYEAFLSFLSKTRFFAHAEADDGWTIGGQAITGDLPWIKDVEAAARGCFPIRRWDPGHPSYGLDDVPSVIAYQDLSDVPKLLDNVRSRPELARLASKTGVDYIRSRSAWSDLVQELKYSLTVPM